MTEGDSISQIPPLVPTPVTVSESPVAKDLPGSNSARFPAWLVAVLLALVTLVA